MNFKNKNIIITGGSNGIGKATAKLLSEKGANIYILDVRHEELKERNIIFLECDVSNFDSVKNSMDKIILSAKKIDGLFVNAGVHLIGNIEETSLDDINKVVSTNINGSFYTLKAVLPYMRSQNEGKIVLMGSDQSFVGKRDSSIYGATKAAIAQLTKSTALDYAKYNIRVNCVCPGTIETDIYFNAINIYEKKTLTSKEKICERVNMAQPMQRIGKPNEVAQVVAFLLSEESSFMTGSLIPIDGGYTAQ